MMKTINFDSPKNSNLKEFVKKIKKPHRTTKRKKKNAKSKKTRNKKRDSEH